MQSLQTAGPLQFMLLYSQVYQRAVPELKATAIYAADSWRDWCREAMKGGAKAAHAYSKGPKTSQVHFDGCKPLVGLGALESVGSEFHEIWASAAEELIPLTGDHLPDFTILQMRVALSIRYTYPRGKACGVDGLSLRSLAVLADPLLTVLTRLMQLIHSWEQHGKPLTTFPMIIVFLTKPSGGVRPVSLMPCFLRVWTSLRLKSLQNWAQQHQTDGIWGRRGRSAELAAWVHQLRLETATWRRQASAAVFLDLRKFFDYIRHRHLMRSGLATGAPIRLLALACRAYSGARVISYAKMA
eukprot:4603663-Amphidinium_carterae.1